MEEKTALLWPFKYNAFEETFEIQIKWIAKALQSHGYLVYKPYNFECKIDDVQDPPWSPDWETSLLPPSASFDLTVYSHSDVGEIKNRERHGRAGNGYIDFPPASIKTGKTLVFKGCAPPEPLSATLDPLGYGSYSSITYEKPPFESVRDEDWVKFYDTEVKEWIKNNRSKWGNDTFQKKLTEEEEDDYYLILAQCPHDAVVTRQDFGGHFETIYFIIEELLRIDNRRKIIVKLHPYTNGALTIREHKTNEPANYHNKINPLLTRPIVVSHGFPEDADIAGPLKGHLERMGKQVKVYKGFESIHSLIAKAKCVFTGNSGAGYDAMMHDKPIISFSQPEYHWVTYDLRKTCDIRRAIQTEEWFQPDLAKKFLYWWTKKYCFYNLETATRRVEELTKGK